MIEKMYAVIMAGGRGERFWPMSTSQHPKQVLQLVGNRSLLVQAIDRLEGLIPPERVLVITSADLVEVTCEAAPGLPRENVIGEPFGRDTAAVCALAWAIISQRDPEAGFCIVTADHVIENVALFQQHLREAFEMAFARDVLITIGIEPSEPSTAFGYIDAGDPVPTEGSIEFFKAERFVEKPHRERAEEYLAAGNYCWNSGMFIWSLSALGNAFRKHCLHLFEMAERLRAVAGTDALDASIAAEYEKLEKISIDYALMEKANNIVMARGVFDWDDVGSWTALENHFEQDTQGNTLVGQTASIDAAKNIVVSRDRLTALIGVDDLIVVQAEGATLICDKDRAQDVKALVKQLKETGGFEGLL